MNRRFFAVFLTLLAVFAFAIAWAEGEGPSFSAPAYVLAGEEAKISFEHVTAFIMDVYRMYDNKTEVAFSDKYEGNGEADIYSIPADYLTTPGAIYYVYLNSIEYEEGYEGSNNWRHLGFARLDAAPSSIVLLTSHPVAKPGETVVFWAYAPNAERISLCFESESFPRDGDCAFIRWRYDAAGKESVYARAVDQNGNTQKSAAIDVTVSSEGSLGSVDWTIAPLVPAKDEELTVTIRATKDQSDIQKVPLYYEISVNDIDDDWKTIAYRAWKTFWEGEDDPDKAECSLFEGGKGEMTIPALTPGHHYRIDAYVSANGYEEASASQFVFVAENAGGDKAPGLEVNGQSEGIVQVKSEQEFRMHVTLPEGATAFRAYTGYNYEMRWEWSEKDSEFWNGEKRIEDFFITMSIRDPGVYPFHVQTTSYSFGEEETPWDLNEEDWDEPISNIVELKVVSDGRIGRAGAALGKETVAVGEMLPVVISSPGEGAEWLGLYLAEEESEWIRYKAEAGTVYYPTARMEPGEHRLVVASYAEGKISAQRELLFTLVEAEKPEQILFEVGTENAIEDEEVPVSVYAPDAKWVRIVGINAARPWDEEREYIFEGGGSISNRIGLETGANTLWAEACFADEEAESGERIEKSREFVVTVSSLGKLSPCPIFVDAIQEAGKDVTFRIDGLAEFENDWWDVHVWDESMEPEEGEEDDFDNTVFRMTARTSALLESFTIPADVIVKDHRYHISLWVDRNGYEGADSEAFFYAADAEKDEDATLEIRAEGGEFSTTGIEDAELRSRVFFRLTAPEEATAFMKFNGRDWNPQEIEDGVATWEEKLDTENTKYAVRCWYGDRDAFYEMLDKNEWQPVWDYSDGDGNHFGGLSNAVTISFAPYTRANTPTAKLNAIHEEDDGAVYRGMYVFIDVNTDEAGIDTASSWVDDVDAHANAEDISFPQTLLLPTAYLEPGDYSAWVNVSGPGKNWSERVAVDFKVLDTQEAQFNVSPDEFEFGKPPVFLMNHEIPFIGYAPGAEHVQVVLLSDGDKEERDERSSGDESIQDSFPPQDPGSYTLRMYAYSEENEQTIVSEIPIVVKSRGSVMPATISAPVILKPDEELSFTVSGLLPDAPEATWRGWNIRIEDRDDDWREIWRMEGEENDVDEQGKYSVRIPWSDGLFSLGHTYKIGVWVDADGYEGADSEASFYVSDAETDKDVTFEIRAEDGEFNTEGIENAELRSRVFFRLTVPEGVSAFMMFNGGDWHSREINDGAETWEERLDTQNTAYVVRCWYGSREAFYEMLDNNNWRPDWAYSDSDGNHFGGLSNAVTVSFAPYTKAKAPTAKLNAIHDEDKGVVYPGMYLIVDVDTDEEGIDAMSAWVDNEDVNAYADGVTMPGMLAVPITGLAPGDYTLLVTVSGQGRNWSEPTPVAFSVKEPKEPQFNVWPDDFDRSSIPPKVIFVKGHEIPFVGYAPGAEALSILLLSEDGEQLLDERGSGEAFIRDSFPPQDKGNYLLRMHAGYPGHEKWEQVGEIPITVIDNGSLLAPQIDAPTLLESGNDLTFTVSGLIPDAPEADWFYWNIRIDDLYPDDPNEEEVWFIDSNRAEADEDGKYKVIIPWEDESGDQLFKKNHNYRISAWVDAGGYEGAYSETKLYVPESIDSRIKLTVNGSAGSVSAPCFTDFTVRVEAPGASMVSLYDEYDWYLLYPEFDPETGIAQYDSGSGMGPGEYTMIARATYDPDFWEKFDEDQPWSWRDMEIDWKAVGEPVKLTLTSKGPIAEPRMDLRVSEEGAVRGERITAVVSYPESGPTPDRIRLNIRDRDGNGDFYYEEFAVESFPFTFSVPTVMLEEGEYRADVEVIKAGYDSARVPDEDISFRVRETGESVIFRAELPEDRKLLPYEDFSVSAFVRGAERLEMYARDVQQEDPGYEPLRWEYFGDSFVDWFRVGEGEYELYILAFGEQFEEDGRKFVYEKHAFAEPTERLEPAEIIMNPIEDAGNAHTITVSGMERADWWWTVTVWDEDNNGELVTEWHKEDESVQTEFTIPEELLLAGHRYSVDVWMDAKYKGGASSNMRFAVIDPEKKKELTLPNALKSVKENAFAGLSDMQLLVLTGGTEGTKLEDGAFAGNDSLIAVQLPEGFELSETWDAFPLGKATVVEFVKE